MSYPIVSPRQTLAADASAARLWRRPHGRRDRLRGRGERIIPDRTWYQCPILFRPAYDPGGPRPRRDMRRRRRLMLLRHAKSDWPSGTPDQERPLGAAAVGTTRRASARRWRDGACGRTSLSSRPPGATRETFTLVSPFLQPTEVRYDRAVYEARNPRRILDVDRAPSTTTIRCLLVVGHNPGLELTAALPDRRGAAPAARQARREVSDRRAGGHRLRRRADGVRLRGNGRLALFLTPGDIE